MTADEDKKLNASYIISVARKLGCSIFLLPEDIVEVNAGIHNPVTLLLAAIQPKGVQNRRDDPIFTRPCNRTRFNPT